MKTKMRDTSLDAYESVKATLNEKQADVFDAIKENPNLCDYELAELLGWKINRIVPRRKELCDMKLIIENGKRLNEATNRRAYIWVTREKRGEETEKNFIRFCKRIGADVKRGFITSVVDINRVFGISINENKYCEITNNYQNGRFSIDDFRGLI